MYKGFMCVTSMTDTVTYRWKKYEFIDTDTLNPLNFIELDTTATTDTTVGS